MLGIALLIGVVTAFNLLIFLWKYQAGRYGDMAMDLLALIVLAAMFGNTILGMLIAMVASMCISLVLWARPSY